MVFVAAGRLWHITLFNAADAMVAGYFSGGEALAAVSSSDNLINPYGDSVHGAFRAKRMCCVPVLSGLETAEGYARP